MFKHTILAVDDHPAWLRLIAKFFTSCKYKVYTATNGAEGLKLAEQHKPDCILLDFLMTGDNGGKVCRDIRANENIKKIPVIMVSSYPQEEGNAHFDYKTDSFVRKGSELVNLHGVVESVIRRVAWERGIMQKGDLRLEPNGCRVFKDSLPLVQLSPNQFRIFSLLLEKSPDFVSEDTIASHVFDSDFAPDKIDAIRNLMCRLRLKLGPRLGRRIINKTNSGWVYIQPRVQPCSGVPSNHLKPSIG